jgi:CBS domain-containing protein
VLNTVACLLKEMKSRRLVSTAPSAIVADAVREMNAENIGAILVMEGQRIVGIFTERDVMVRVVGAKLDPATTPVSEVMTAPVRSVELTSTVDQALRLMSAQHRRHLPVLRNGQVERLVSIRDLTDWIIRSQQKEFDAAINFANKMGMSNRRA